MAREIWVVEAQVGNGQWIPLIGESGNYRYAHSRKRAYLKKGDVSPKKLRVTRYIPAEGHIPEEGIK